MHTPDTDGKHIQAPGPSLHSNDELRSSVQNMTNPFLRMMDFVSEMMSFLMDFVSKNDKLCIDPRHTGGFVLQMMIFSFKMMNFSFKMMNFAFKMINFAFKMMDFSCQRPGEDRCPAS